MMGFLDVLQKWMGDPTDKVVKRSYAIVEAINTKEAQLQHLSDEDFQKKVAVLRDRVQSGLSTKEALPEAFALVKNAARRLVGKKYTIGEQEEIWNMIPYDVQLLGGIVLHSGRISEMKTGEGKTLVATMPAFLESLTGNGVHIVTVNDYLAQRDAAQMRFLYEFLGASVGVIVHGQTPTERKAAYSCDIAYATNNELGFDYLRDNMAQSQESMVQRKLAFAIVDEVDSILIDEARTPLIISAPAEEVTDKYQKYTRLVKQLTKDEHFIVDEKQKTAVLNENGIAKMEELLGVDNIYSEMGFAEVHHIEAALKANAVFVRDKDYVVKEGEIVIVDEFTGRLMPGRRYSDGLHQALEAREGVEIKRESKTLATITFQNFFRLYKKLAGMTGTAKTEEEEFLKIYGLEVAVIPTNKPITRKDLGDLVFKNERGKFQAIAKKAKEKHEAGQPVLIGTISIERSELLSAMLQKEKIPHEVLNAKNHAREAQIIANAGQAGVITIATNMAGRGTDIKLGEGVADLGGLCIIGSERHESRRIDNQLRGRAGRQGDAGETQFFVSLEDSLMRLFGSERLQKMMDALRIPDDQPIENRLISSSIESAQKKVEGHHFDTRKHVVQYDDVMNKQRTIIYARRRKLLEQSDVHEDILQWIDKSVDRLATAHFFGREAHEYEYEDFAKGISALHAEGAPSANEYEHLETENKISDFAKKFLHNTLVAKEKSLPDPQILRNVERTITLRTIDALWKEHIDEMTHLREQVALVGYAQKNPLHEYQSLGYEKFVSLLSRIESATVRTIFQINIQMRTAIPASPQPKLQTNADKIATALTARETVDKAGPHRVRASNNGRISADTEIIKEKPVVGRNENCPCGSGKKFKKCCGKA